MAACRYASEMGYRYAVLNSTDIGRPTYRHLGFRTTGEGWTWWLTIERLVAQPPQAADVRLAESVGRGDEAGLASHRADHPAYDLNRLLTNGMEPDPAWPPHCRQPLVGGRGWWRVAPAIARNWTPGTLGGRIGHGSYCSRTGSRSGGYMERRRRACCMWRRSATMRSSRNLPYRRDRTCIAGTAPGGRRHWNGRIISGIRRSRGSSREKIDGRLGARGNIMYFPYLSTTTIT